MDSILPDELKRTARREPYERGPERAAKADRLPPHSIEAEQGVLGCILLAPTETLPSVEQRFADVDSAFYDLRHRTLFQVLKNMSAEAIPIDSITLNQRLKDLGNLESSGGLEYIGSLVDATPSAANLPMYLDIVWEKYLARKWIQVAGGTVAQIYEWNGLSEGLWTEICRSADDWRQSTERHSGLPPRELIAPMDVEAEFMDEWYNRHKEAQGWALPFPLADFRVKLSEFTLVVGDSESGKSTLFSEVLVCLAKQGAKPCIASFEMPRRKLLTLLVKQLIGTNQVPEGAAGEKILRNAMGWLQRRFRIYNILGIGDWRRVLDVFTYAYEQLGHNVFLLDNLGLIGIGDEDYEQQGAAMAAFAHFAHNRKVHLFGVQHINKGDGNFKQKVRGSKRATDYADNAFEVIRNDKKRETVADLLEKKRVGELEEKEVSEKLFVLRQSWDGKCILRKHRYGDGERENCSRYLFFDWRSKQFRVRLEDAPINYLLE